MGLNITTIYDGTLTATVTASVGCSLATASVGGDSLVGQCDAIEALQDGSVATTIVSTAFPTNIPMIAVQVPDNGPGAAAPNGTPRSRSGILTASRWGIAGAVTLVGLLG